MNEKSMDTSVWEVPVCKYGTVYIPVRLAHTAEEALKIAENQEFESEWLDENDEWETINGPDELEIIDDEIPF